MYRYLLPLLTLLASCASPSVMNRLPTGADGSGARPVCDGAVVTVWGEDSLLCDVQPPQVLVVLGITEARCDDLGGVWVYEACEDVDY